MYNDLQFKPGEHCLVSHTMGYQHTGQIISRPIGDGNIMCRMVPDDPCTMIFIPMDRLRSVARRYRWVHYAAISGRGQFPVDMLRYDQAAPVNFTLHEDSHGRVSHEMRPDQDSDSEVLIVASCSLIKNEPWTFGRWASFLWNVSPLRTLRLEAK